MPGDKDELIPLRSDLRPDVTIAELRGAAQNDPARQWRSFGELAETPRFRQALENEFPSPIGADTKVDRRGMLKLMAASAAMAGLTGCTKLPTEFIVPYVRQPERIIPGKPLFYATAVTLGGVALGVLVESHLARPTKIEGNPDHPSSLGATDKFAQAAVLGMWDPDRAKAEVHDGRIGSWAEFQQELAAALDEERKSGGAGLRLLTGCITSPVLGAQVNQMLKAFPAAKWHQYESVNRDNVLEGCKLAFGQYLNPVYRVDRAQVILSLDSDFLTSGPGCVRYSHDFALNRRSVWDSASPNAAGGAQVGSGAAVSGAQLGNMSRIYAVEATPTSTGAVADHRLTARGFEIEYVARALARQLGMNIPAGPAVAPAVPDAWIAALAKDLKAHTGTSLIVAGDQQPPLVHALVHAMNETLGNFDQTVYFTPPLEVSAINNHDSIGELAADIRAGQVTTLMIMECNPVYSAPADLDFKSLLPSVKFSAHLALYEDETSALCHWHVPQAHSLESWGDARAHDGTVGIIQPLIEPLYFGKSDVDFLAAVNGNTGQSSHDILRQYWQNQQTAAADFDAFWEKTLRDGVMADTAWPAQKVSVKPGVASQPPAPAPQGLEIIFRPDPTIWDGRFANNGFLQELPKPLTEMTWDSVVMLSPRTAQRLGVYTEDTVELKYRGRTIQAPVWVMPNHANESATVFLGYGRTRVGNVGNGMGYDAGWIRPHATPDMGGGLEIRKVGTKWALATIQDTSVMEGRDLLRTATLDEYRNDPKFAQGDVDPHRPSLYPPYPYNGYAWGMAVDLNACTGCGACVVACTAENNVAVVGKTQVLIGRHMHWLRIDRYYQGGIDSPTTLQQPVLCMHCEDAPCEVVCPVQATVHSSEGLNEMVYNRCVGTRYCSNNCPYKVRRFNFLLFSDWQTPSLFGMRNPNVTVRSRGVMEKCSYCVQRIQAAKIESEEENRTVMDGEIVTACQQACPTGVFVFGNINDPNSRVSKLRAQTLNYSMLAELNVRPRTTYLARVTNPNPEIA